MNLIDRDALCTKCVQEYGKCNSINRGRCGVAKAKAVDAVPVVHGEWAKSEYNGFLKCSVCNDCYVDAEWVSNGKWGFCPHCGAKMDKEN